jgi:HSP20 family protein
MALVRWAPRKELEGYTPFARDPFFRRFFDMLDDDEFFHSGRTWYPAMDLVDEKDRLVVHLEVPGVDAKDVQVQLQGDLLTIQGERQEDRSEASDTRYLRREQTRGLFQRTLQLPYAVQADKVKAQYRNGIMTITLPKAEEHVGRQIPVQFEK